MSAFDRAHLSTLHFIHRSVYALCLNVALYGRLRSGEHARASADTSTLGCVVVTSTMSIDVILAVLAGAD